MIETSLSHRIATHNYSRVCGIVDPIARRQLFKFADGIYDMGLWPHMVCWPLRSSQNAGTGTTAYSFGGLGTYNGTLVNGPTWGVDGVSMSSSCSMETGVLLGSSPCAIVSVHHQITYVGGNANLFFTAGINVSGRQVSDFNTSNYNQRYAFFWYNAWPPAFASTISSLNDVDPLIFNYTAWRVRSSSQMQCSYNSFQSNAGTMTDWDTSSPTCTRFGIFDLGGDIKFSFLATFDVDLDNNKDSQVRALYKSTLGQGLGLP